MLIYPYLRRKLHGLHAYAMRMKILFNSEKPTFHKRELPSNLIALSSKEGRKIFSQALESGDMESYFPLSEQFVTQSEPSFCSLSTLAMVLNALSFDPKRVWKGSWRWVSEEMLQCESANLCGHSIERIKSEGMDFDEFASLAKCHGVTIQSFRASRNNAETDFLTFRETIKSVSRSSDGSKFIVVNFSRKSLGQTGSGHFSPIGGYHAALDLALILDVARFKYPPYWVPMALLWQSMEEEDKHSKESRGYFIISSASTSAGAEDQLSPTQCSHVPLGVHHTHHCSRTQDGLHREHQKS